jgi:hypothetical protein
MNLSGNNKLNRLFTYNTFMGVINNENNSLYESCINTYLKEEYYSNNSDIVNAIYNYLKKNYRNEYFYKNTLINKLLLGKYSTNTTTALTEIPINKSKADFILINGKAVVYEIKTGLDTFERLDNQIIDYYKAFKYVTVLTCESNYYKLSKLLEGSSVGISILTDRNTISVRKNPIENNKFLDYLTIFKILRKREYENIIIKHYGKLPSVAQVALYKECFNLFSKIEIEKMYNYFLNEIRSRNMINKTEFQKVPYELKFLMYFSNQKNKEYKNLFGFLSNKWRE